MNWTTQRRSQLLFLVAAIGMACCVGQPGQVRGDEVSENWLYAEELGGWLDLNTGLVWGETQFIDNTYGYAKWDWASTRFLTLHRANTGIDDWRLATVSELQTIAANGGWSHLYSWWEGGYNGGGAPVWSSEERGKKHAYVVSHSGIPYVVPKTNIFRLMPVYRLFTP